MVKFITRERIESAANETLMKMEKLGKTFSLPIDVDLIGECLYELEWDWDIIAEPPNVRIWAGLYPEDKRVRLNETHKNVFAEKPGFERFTKAHEIGHWVLHVDYGALNTPSLPGFEKPQTILCRDGDKSPIERQADMYAAALLMPKDQILSKACEFDLDKFRNLYDLAKVFDVTITALVNRLREFGIRYVDAQGRIHTSAAEANGQMLLL